MIAAHAVKVRAKASNPRKIAVDERNVKRTSPNDANGRWQRKLIYANRIGFGRKARQKHALLCTAVHVP